MSRRVVHLISEYSAREAMGRTVAETAARVAGEHHLVTTRVHDGADAFASVTELGGSLSRFPAEDPTRLDAVLDGIDADVVHVHAGVLGSFLANRARLHRRTTVLTMYAWPNLPGRAAWQHAGWSGLRSSNVLPTRVIATAAVPAFAVHRSLMRLGPKAILTPDPRVKDKLAALPGIPVTRLPSGAPVDLRRARFESADGRPTVVFAGRAESVRGIGTLVDAFPDVLRRVPSARLRLLVLPRPELAGLRARAERLGLGDAVEFRTEPVPDLLAEFAAAQVGAWPFLADYTTSPPAMALAEAMAVGLPVVSTPVACVQAVMRPGMDGLAVPPGNQQALAEALVRLLTDRVAWQRYATAGPAATAKLSWNAAAEATEAAYRRVNDHSQAL
jgi:glycosyltransferase involved in cell wall biosynthesis